MNPDIDLGKKLKQAREQAGLSQEELAHMLGYQSRSSINKIEAGVQKPPLSAIKSFAQELGLSPSALVERQELEYRGDNARPSSESPELQKLLALAKKAPTKDVNMAIAVLKALRSARKEDDGSADSVR